MITIEAGWLSTFFRLAVIGLELAGTLTILVGAALATILFAKRARAGDRTEAYSAFRSALGRSILLGLEFLVAGDIVKSLVINPTLDDLIVLAGLVLVRTFLSISLGSRSTAIGRGRKPGWRGRRRAWRRMVRRQRPIQRPEAERQR
ncbi:MAG: DUF1622 domain-containing protein [Sphingobium sp.]|nr:DUF1622 domain-containing protein [Sphingobium sp.]